MDLLSMQENNVPNLSIEVTRASQNDANVKAKLAAANHDCWLLTSR